MLPKSHFIFGLIFSLLLLFLFPQIEILGFLIIFASSFLIDVDHYLFYVFIKKDYSLKNAYHWFMEKHRKFRNLSRSERRERLKQKGPLPCIFHGIEAIAVLIILSFFSKFFLYILIGFLFHEVLDFIWAIYLGEGYSHFGSQIYNYFEFKRRLKNAKKRIN